MANRSVRLLPGAAPVLLGTRKYLERMETTFEADLDSNARSGFESRFLSIVEHFVAEGNSSLASGWFEHNAASPIYGPEDDNAQARTHCTHVVLFEMHDTGDHSAQLSDLLARLSQVSFLPHTRIKSSLNTTMTYMDTPRPLSTIPGLTPPAQFSTLDGALQLPTSRTFSNEVLDDRGWGGVPGVNCVPSSFYAVSQGSLYNLPSNLLLSPFGMLGYLAGPPLEPYMVDVAWLTTRSTLDKVKRRVSKMLNHRVRQLPGYVGGFWVCASDSVHGFGVFTVWYGETARGPCIREYREILDRFVEASSYIDVPPAHQSFPWARANESGSPNRTWLAPLVEVITFVLPRDLMRRNLFEISFGGIRGITAPRAQSGHLPDACRLALAGGWAPHKPQNEPIEEEEDRFNCFLEWHSDEARVQWYKNLGKRMCQYDEFGRWLDELKMFAELGIESRIVLTKDRF